MLAIQCCWCGSFTLEEESNEVAVYDEEDNITGYEVVCCRCYDYLIEGITITTKALKD